jgi:hypothetical protein
MILFDPDAVEEFRQAITDAERVEFDRSGLPRPAAMEPLLAPLLRGRLAYDGSSRQSSRFDGWWMFTSRGWKQPVSIPILSKSLDVVIRPIRDEMAQPVAAVRAERDRFYNSLPHVPGLAESVRRSGTARQAAELERLDLALALSGGRSSLAKDVHSFVTTSSDRYLGGLMELLRQREDFELPDDVVVEIVRAHLGDAAMVADCDLRTPTLRPLKAALDSCGCKFPEARLVPALRTILGHRLGPNGRPFFGPIDFDELAAGA